MAVLPYVVLDDGVPDAEAVLVCERLARSLRNCSASSNRSSSSSTTRATIATGETRTKETPLHRAPSGSRESGK